MHRTGELYGQFETLEQQKESASLGMWVFLVTEVLFFGGMFMTYTINRTAHPEAFGVGGNTLDIKLGTMNTGVLILSSFTMAMSVWCSHVGKKKWIPICLLATMILGCAFLGIKVIEYKQKFDHHLIPGHSFDIRYCVNNPSACGLTDPQKIQKEVDEIDKASKADSYLNGHAQLYFSLYFGMTGLHALHMIVGVGLLLFLFKESIVGRYTTTYNTPVEMVGLYWHFVDIVWIYLFPLLYLIDRKG